MQASRDKYHAQGRWERRYKMLVGKLKGGEDLKDQGVDRRIILTFIL
jgi:hypothetical protein